MVRNRLIGIGEYGNISAKAFYQASVSWWDLCLDGKYLLDGSCIMNAVRSPFLVLPIAIPYRMRRAFLWKGNPYSISNHKSEHRSF